MKRTLLLFSFWLALPDAPHGSQLRQPANTGTVEVIVSGSDGRPLERVNVRLTADSVPITAATTDTGGRVVFRALAAGHYAVEARRNGYLTRDWDGGAYTAATTNFSLGDPPPLNPANHIVRLRLVPEGIITGRVRDSKGRALPGASVSLVRINYQFAQRYLYSFRSVSTNDLGEYRIFGLPAGEYYVRVDNNPGDTPTYVSRTYYSGANEIRDATLIAIKEGQEVGGINLDVTPVRGVTISGTVVNTQTGGAPQPDGSVLRYIRMYLVPVRDGLAESVALNNPNTGSNKESQFPFEIRDVPPGSYDLYSTFTDRTVIDGDTVFVPRILSGRTRIEVGEKDLEGIHVTILEGAEIHGKLSFRGEDTLSPGFQIQTWSGSSGVRLQSVTENLSPYETLGSSFFGNMEDDEKFAIANLIPGKYRLPSTSSIRSLQRGNAYLEDLRQDGRSIYADGIVTIGDSRSDMELVVNLNGGAIHGAVDVPEYEPGNISVVLVPNGPLRKNSALHKFTFMGKDGLFEFKGVAPGNYKVFAFEVFPGAQGSPEFIAPYEQQGTAVTARAGTRVEAPRLQIIRPR
jgi:hypothetical protein